MKNVLLSLTILVLAACQQSNETEEARRVYQAQAQQLLARMAVKINRAKGVASNRSRGVGTDGTWVPYQRIYIRAQIGSELEDCRAYSDQIAITRENFQTRITTLFQCAMQAVQYRNPFMTSLYRNANNQTQNLWQYDGSWRYPSGYSQFGQNYPWLNTYYSYGQVGASVPFGP